MMNIYDNNIKILLEILSGLLMLALAINIMNIYDYFLEVLSEFLSG